MFKFKRDTLLRADGKDYMERWVLTYPFGMVRIHKIISSDVDYHLHDHPWDFVTIMLKGSYCEHTPINNKAKVYPCATSMEYHFAPSARFIRADEYHRLTVNRGPIWTLVLTGRKKNKWGFLTRDGKLQWREVEGQMRVKNEHH